MTNCRLCECIAFEPLKKNKQLCLCGHIDGDHNLREVLAAEPEIPVDIPDSEDMEEEEMVKHYKLYSSKPIQKLIYKYIVRHKGGAIGGISGRVNTGKSLYGCKIITEWNPRMYSIKEVNGKKLIKLSFLCYDVEDIFAKTFENIKINGKVITKEEFQNITDIKKWCEENIQDIKVRPGRAILVDEAGTSIYNRDFFSVENKAMAKLVQVWRFMRMLVIFVVPERMELLERTLREFFDFKIEMIGIDSDGGYARAVAYERKGRNYKTQEPIFARIPGCRHGGFIKVRNLEETNPDIAYEYKRLSDKYKTTIMMEVRREVMESSGEYVAKKRGRKVAGIEEYLDEAKRERNNFKRENRKTKEMIYSVELIQNKFNVGLSTAARIRAALEQDDKNASA